MSNIDKKFVALNIRAAMGKELLSVKELAKKSGLTMSQINNALYARSVPIESIEKIANALNVKLVQLISHEALIQTEIFDTGIYSKIILEINNVFTFYKIRASIHTTEKIAAIAYNNFSDIKDLTEAIKGMVLAFKEFSPDIQKL